MKDGFGNWAAAYHVHVNGCFDVLGQIGARIEQRGCAFDLRRPDESDRSGRARQLAFVDQLLQGTCDFENGHATAGIVIGSGPLVVKMATESNLFLLQLRIGARNRRSNNLIVGCMFTGANHGMKVDLLSSCQTLA